MTVKTVNLRTLIVSLIPPAAVGLAGTVLVASGMDVYNLLSKPAFTPPGWLFGVVWTLLYVLMGVAVYLLKSSHSYDLATPMQFYYIQLALNFLWVMFFFRFGLLWLSVVVLCLLIAAIVLTIINFYRINKTSAYLLIPYLVWCVFALVLNITIAIMN